MPIPNAFGTSYPEMARSFLRSPAACGRVSMPDGTLPATVMMGFYNASFSEPGFRAMRRGDDIWISRDGTRAPGSGPVPGWLEPSGEVPGCPVTSFSTYEAMLLDFAEMDERTILLTVDADPHAVYQGFSHVIGRVPGIRVVRRDDGVYLSKDPG